MSARQFLLSGWEWSPAAVALCIVAQVAYGVAFGLPCGRRAGWLAAGLGLFALTWMSPVGTLANGYLFSAHMLQHLVLLLIVPALWWLSLPAARVVEDAENPVRMRSLVLSWAAGVGAMWVWHVPALCDAAATSRPVQWVQTISLLALGALFWRPILSRRAGQRLLPLLGVGYLSTACFACTLLGIYITFSPVAVCAVYHHPVDRLGILPLIREGWGMTPSVDQQVGGLMMWVPACLIYLTGIIAQLARWYGGEGETEVAAATVTEKREVSS